MEWNEPDLQGLWTYDVDLAQQHQSSEVQPRTEGNLAAGGCAADASERRRVDVGVRVVEYRVVQHVRNVHPKFQLAHVIQPDPLGQVHV